MRSNKELRELLLSNQELFHSGLCAWIGNIHRADIITSNEYLHLRALVDNNAPTYRFYHKFINPDGIKEYSAYYWTFGAIAPRIKWIKKYLK